MPTRCLNEDTLNRKLHRHILCQARIQSSGKSLRPARMQQRQRGLSGMGLPEKAGTSPATSPVPLPTSSCQLLALTVHFSKLFRTTLSVNECCWSKLLLSEGMDIHFSAALTPGGCQDTPTAFRGFMRKLPLQTGKLCKTERKNGPLTKPGEAGKSRHE